VTALLCGMGAALFTFIGGAFALKHSDELHLILSFSAGAVLGVALFHLLPEAIDLAAGHYEIPTITSIVALGFGCYMVMSRWLLLSPAHPQDCKNPRHLGQIGAGTISFHSFMDGAAIGVGFQASYQLGIAVAVAVVIHDFSDGINTVALILKNRGDRKLALRWLTIDASAPFAGVVSTSFFTMPSHYLAPALAMFCGFFLYIGASDLLPESHHAHPKSISTLMTVVGFIVFFFARHIAKL
jgi:zinc transporter ZupT